jgi:alginate production protein
MRSAALLLGLASLAGACSIASLAGAQPVPTADEPLAPEDEEDEEEEEEEELEDLRQRLTEREDQRRPLRPWSTRIAGHKLALGGEYEAEFGYLRRRVFDEDDEGRPDRFGMEHALEVEAFYTLGEPLSFFAQVQAVLEEDPDPQRESYDSYVQFSELWIASNDIAGSDVSLDFGRLDFEDERRWWWDDEVDAVRLTWEPAEAVEISLAFGQQLFSDRSDRYYVEADEEEVLRVIGQASWGWRRDHVLELFASYQDDHSPSQLGESVDEEREDDSDADVTWLGVRAMGVLSLGGRGLLGYWLDTALVTGSEKELVDRGEPDERVEREDISGTAFDVGASWILPFDFSPRLFAGYARGSREFLQTGLQANEAGFGGVERFPSYGLLLDPELSNVSVVTAGAGISLLRSSSLDLVYHHYQRVDPERPLEFEDLDATLDERHHDVGHGVDLVLALEEWEQLEFLFALSALRAGDAFTDRPDTWSYGGFAVVRFAF